MIHPDSPQFSRLTILDQDHLTLLNGICSSHPKVDCLCSVAYNAFTKYGRSSSWCKAHALNFRAMSRAVSIRSQLKKYMIRFNLPLQSCEGDAKRLRQCLVSGYWRNGARWVADGTYRSVKGNKVSNAKCTIFTIVHSSRLYMFTQHLCSSLGSRGPDGWSSTKWKKPRGHSMSTYLYDGL